MPVTLRQINATDEHSLIGCRRVVQSNLAVSTLTAQWQQYSQQPDRFELWAGVFNDRIVGFSIIENSQVLALAVHRATQNRGVATRMIELLYKNYSALQWPPSLERFKQK